MTKGSSGRMDPAAAIHGAFAAGLLVLAIYFGSSRGRHFDPALVLYTSSTVFAAFAIVYRYSIWLQKPPTRLYWQRGWKLFLRPADIPRNVVWLGQSFWKNFIVQSFIEKRNRKRWAAHFLLSWGCIVACLITFPLVFGWVHMDADPQHPSLYRTYFAGVPAGAFESTSLIGWMVFHGLDFCAVAVIGGMAIAMQRRVSDPGAMSVQQFANDHAPLMLLFSVAVTGLMLTASVTCMKGHSYSFLALLHAFSVIITLLYLPFGKFFHIFQRPASLGVQLYKLANKDQRAYCIQCGLDYGSKVHTEDLKRVLMELGIDQGMEDSVHYQDLCPQCRRRILATTQAKAIGGHQFI